MWIFVFVLCVPFIEIALFILVGGWLTLWPTLGLVLASTIAGMLLIRKQGLEIRNTLRMGPGIMRDPLSPVAHNVMIFCASVLLIIPGFFTDAIALLLLIPQFRQVIIAYLANRIGNPGNMRAFGAKNPGRARPASDWDDAEFEEIAPERKDPGPPSGWTRH